MARFGSPEELTWLECHGSSVDSVELKAPLVPPVGPLAEALTGRAAPNWSVRQMYLLDTVALDLVRAGVEVRLRRRARGRYDLAVSAHRGGTDQSATTPPGVRVEFDVVPGGLWQDLEVRRDVDAAAAAAAIAGTASCQGLLSRPQRVWACTGGDKEVDEVRLRELMVYGPLLVHRVKVAAPGPGLRRADLELFRYPSGRELMELSTRCGPQEVCATVRAFERLLTERRVLVDPACRTKISVWQEEIES